MNEVLVGLTFAALLAAGAVIFLSQSHLYKYSFKADRLVIRWTGLEVRFIRYDNIVAAERVVFRLVIASLLRGAVYQTGQDRCRHHL